MKSDYLLFKFAMFIFAPALIALVYFLVVKAKRKLAGKNKKSSEPPIITD